MKKTKTPPLNRFIFNLMLVLPAVIMVTLVCVTQASAQSSSEGVYEAWVSRYDGPAGSYDEVATIAVDASGNVYITGLSYGNGTSSDYATIKYDTNGNQLWLERYNGPASGYDDARALAVDASGNVYVTGRSVRSGDTTDYATIKYDTDGNQIWVKRYNGPVDKTDSGRALAVDGSGNVYVFGYSQGSETDNDYDYATIKYDPDGNELWVKRYDGPGYTGDDEEYFAIAVDGSGNAYITGDSGTIKYDTDGNQLWVAPYDSLSDLALDGSGNVYVTGSIYESSTSDDYATIKYDTDRNQLWLERYNYDWDIAEAIALDGSGNVYVTGNSEGDYATIKYAPSLNADFSASSTSGPVPLSVNFTDQSTGDSTSWSWDFGDGATSTEQNPAHTYTDSGTYTVSLTVTGPGETDTETKTDFIVARDASFSSAAAFAVLANMYSDSAMANAVNALDDPAYYPLAALYASSAYEYAEDAYEDATAALAAAGQDYTFWGYYAPVYAENDINVRFLAVGSINLAAQYAAQGDLETAEYYLGYGSSLAATADLYNGSTIWCASMEASGQAAAQQSSATSKPETSANGSSSFASAATNAVLANMNFATSVTYGVSALDDPSYIPLVQLYASTAYDYTEAAYNEASAALAEAGQDSTFWGTYAVQYAESDMNNKADALSAFDQAVLAYQAGDLETADYYLCYGFLPACLADLYNGTTIWCASIESEGATK